MVAIVLAALCVLSLEDGHRVVLAALSDFRVAHEKFRFEYLVNSISVKDAPSESGGVEDEDEVGLWEYRSAVMSLINAITNSPEDLEERMTLRDEFARRGLNEAMAVRFMNSFFPFFFPLDPGSNDSLRCWKICRDFDMLILRSIFSRNLRCTLRNEKRIRRNCTRGRLVARDPSAFVSFFLCSILISSKFVFFSRQYV